MRTIFLDREGTLITEPYDGVISNPDNVWLQADVEAALPKLAEIEARFFLTTMQPAVGQSRITKDQYVAVATRVEQLLAKYGLTITKTYACLHAPFEGCDCKKPKPGLLRQASADYPDIDFADSWVVGDRLEDIGFGKSVGAQTILLDREGKYVEGTADYLAKSLQEVVDIIIKPF